MYLLIGEKYLRINKTEAAGPVCMFIKHPATLDPDALRVHYNINTSKLCQQLLFSKTQFRIYVLCLKEYRNKTLV